MHSKLAGHLSLQELITETIESSRTKLAAAEEKKEDKKVEKLLKFEKKEHGHIPSEKEEEAEKKSSANPIDPFDPDEVSKLASALEAMSDDIIKEADEKNVGGESKQGGEVLGTASPVGGKQSYKKDSSKAHNVPMTTPLQKKMENGKATTATEDTQHGGHVPVTAAYPKKGVLKTAAMEKHCTCSEDKEKCEVHPKEKKSSAVSALQAALTKKAGFEEMMKAKAEKGEKKEEPKAEKKEEKKDEKKEEAEKKASPSVDFILKKIAESTQGGETLDSKSGEGPKPESGSAGGNDARKAIESNQAAINMKKVDGKKPQKKMLSEVLTEPAMSKSHDSKVQDNLRNASKGGVKIAAVKTFLSKVAADPNDPNHAKLKEAVAKMKGKKEKDSMGGSSMGAPSSTPGMM